MLKVQVCSLDNECDVRSRKANGSGKCVLEFICAENFIWP